MTFETKPLGCLVCAKPALTIEVDQAENLHAVCSHCSMRIPVATLAKVRSERVARESNKPARAVVGASATLD